ncbi:MAG TPA: hypothetical protein VIX63_08710, partial [Vicinamibacterales bacterium]
MRDAISLFRRLVVVAALFVLTFESRAVTQAPAPAFPPVSVDLSRYAPDVRTLLTTSYLGRARQEPDPGEPAAVLKEYLTLGSHGAIEQLYADPVGLGQALTRWRAVARGNPQSRHAVLGLARVQSVHAELATDPASRRAAADSYVRAATLGMDHGRVRYTREVSRALVDAGDDAGLDRVFTRMLAVARRSDAAQEYLALID